MDDEELKQRIKETYLDEVIDFLERNGRHWIMKTRSEMKVLTNLIKESGCKINTHEVPPEWEFVIDSVETDWDEIKEIAEQRSLLKAQGTNENEWPV